MTAQPRKNASRAAQGAQLNREAQEKQGAQGSQEGKKASVDFGALVAGAKVAKELPKMRREAQENPFVGRVRESFEKGEAYVLPPVPEEAVTPVKVAIRRGATLAELGVSIREEKSDEGVVITFMGKTRSKRSTEE